MRIVRYGADGYTLNCTGGGRVTCMGRGGPWARFFVEASPADPALVRLVPEQARHLVVAANADGNLLSAVPAEEAGEAAEAWFTKHGDERQCRFESLAFPGKSVTTHASSDVVLGAGRGTVFTLEACTRTAVGSRRHRNPEPDSHLVERPGRGGGGSGAFSSSGFLGRAARAAMGAMGRGPAPSPGPRGVALSEADKVRTRACAAPQRRDDILRQAGGGRGGVAPPHYPARGKGAAHAWSSSRAAPPPPKRVHCAARHGGSAPRAPGRADGGGRDWGDVGGRDHGTCRRAARDSAGTAARGGGGARPRRGGGPCAPPDAAAGTAAAAGVGLRAP